MGKPKNRRGEGPIRRGEFGRGDEQVADRIVERSVSPSRNLIFVRVGLSEVNAYIDRLPRMRADTERQLAECRAELRRLPVSTHVDPTVEILRLLTEFCQDLNQ